MKRREFMLGGTAAVAAWSHVSRAQQLTIPLIGYLSGASMTGEVGFQQGLKETGLVENRDFAIEYRSTNGQNDRLPAIVADVVARRVAVILAVSDSFALAAKAATTTIPIVYIGGND